MSDEFEMDAREDRPATLQADPSLYAPRMTVPNAQERQREGYFGSVRFFKHLILTVLVLLILVPATLAVAFALRSHELGSVMEQMQDKIDAQAELLSAQQLQTQAAQPVISTPEQPDAPQPEAKVPAWQSLYPDLYAAGAARSSVDEAGTVYLTFDDGPSAQTPKILEVLAQYNVKATFFVVGKPDPQSRQYMQAIVNAGHTIGIHSYSHEMSDIYGSVELFLDDFKQMYDLILETTGVAPQVFRFPGGSINGYNAATYQEIIAEMVRRGFVYFDWNMMTGDAIKGDGPSVETLVSNALKDAGNYRRIMLLMHDLNSKPNTAAALPAIIEGYLDAGFSIAPLTPEVKPVIFSYPN